MSYRLRATPKQWMPRGDALAFRETDGKPIVIWGGIPGEEGVVEVTYEGMNQDFGRHLISDHPSANRVKPPCDRYNGCGGCPLMHLNEEGQKQAHRQMLRGALDEAHLSDVEIGEHHTCDGGLDDFRHVIKLGVGTSDQGHLRVGAWARGTRKVIPIPNCKVAAPELRQIMLSIARLVIDLGLWPYKPELDQGVLRSFVLRASKETGLILVTVVAGRRIREIQEFADQLMDRHSSISGVWLHLNDESGNSIFSKDEEGAIKATYLAGSPTIQEKIGEITYEIGPGDFFQTNPYTAEQLYARVFELLRDDRKRPFVDLYCGVGGLALQAARHAAWVIGVDEVDGAIKRARESARKNHLSVEFVSGVVDDVLENLARRLSGTGPVVCVNPARRGLEEGVVEKISNLEPYKVVYISCNPRAMARDLVNLREAGFSIGEIEVFEMFPNTAHMECLVILKNTKEITDNRRAPRRSVVR